MAYTIKVNLTEAEKDSGELIIEVETRGQAKAVNESLKSGHTVEVSQTMLNFK